MPVAPAPSLRGKEGRQATHCVGSNVENRADEEPGMRRRKVGRGRLRGGRSRSHPRHADAVPVSTVTQSPRVTVGKQEVPTPAKGAGLRGGVRNSAVPSLTMAAAVASSAEKTSTMTAKEANRYAIY